MTLEDLFTQFYDAGDFAMAFIVLATIGSDRACNYTWAALMEHTVVEWKVNENI